MNKFNTIEEFFDYAYTQAKTQEQRLALYFVKEGYMLSNHLAKLTWEDIDLENGQFKSFNYRGSFQVKMSEQMREELTVWEKHKEKGDFVFSGTENIHNLLATLVKTLKNYPILQDALDNSFVQYPTGKMNNLKEALNEYWANHRKDDEPYIDYLRTVAALFEESDKLFLFGFLYSQHNDLHFVLNLKWQDVAKDGSSVKYGHCLREILLPNDLKIYVKRNLNKFSPNDLVFPPESEWRNLKKNYFILLANKTFGEIVENPNIEILNKTKIQSENQTRLCLKAWNQKEISATGNILPCCIMPYDLFHMNTPNQTENGLRALRKHLLNGTLNNLCANCYITPVVEKKVLQNKIKELQKKQRQDDLLAPLPIEDLRVYTSDKCNLRCTYCTISEEGHIGYHMRDDVFEHALHLAQNASKNVEIHLNGHGEATFHPKWREYFSEFLKTGKTLILTTNLASKYTEDDYKILARLDKLYVSLDSDDEEMTVAIRKKIKPRVIYERIQKIQDAAKELNIDAPTINISIGVYNPSIWKMEEFMQKLITLNIQGVGFWQMKEVTSNRKATSIIHLTKEKTQKARAIFHKSVQILKQNNLTVSIAQDLICSDALPLYQENLISENNEQKKKKLSLFQRLNALLGKNEI